MIRTVRVMLEPNNRQSTKLFQYAGAARYAYNWTLRKEQEKNKNDLCRDKKQRRNTGL